MSDNDQDNVGTRIFLGNLSFRVRENDLQELLQPYGEVLSVKLARRMNRFLGFAFAVFREKKSADEAVEKLNNTVFHDRELIVEIAHPSPARKTNENRLDSRASGNHSGADSNEERGGGPGRNRSRNLRQYSQDRVDGNYEEARDDEVDGDNLSGHRQLSGRPRQRPRGGHVTEAQDGNGESHSYQRGPYRRRPARSRANLPDSDTLLFVSNLPFSYEDEDLAKVFEGLSITSAHVVKRFKGICRGFGFVDMVDHAAQLDAIEKVNNKEVDGRVLTVKIAKVRQEDAPPPRDDVRPQKGQPIEIHDSPNGAPEASPDQSEESKTKGSDVNDGAKESGSPGNAEANAGTGEGQ